MTISASDFNPLIEPFLQLNHDYDQKLTYRDALTLFKMKNAKGRN